jgi:hypothetical protein
MQNYGRCEHFVYLVARYLILCAPECLIRASSVHVSRNVGKQTFFYMEAVANFSWCVVFVQAQDLTLAS